MPQNALSCQAWVRNFCNLEPPIVGEPNFLWQQRSSRNLDRPFLGEMGKQKLTECLM
ncbi:hypothetical protein [Leptolyngbya sp. GGD]|uniref:hypothetical protein n=1 Tax=Leptolyngbya sp. GGD TaxID=2997907 RepID=UPI00227C4D0D|nr:hypothetical protein [Leptolyngbya sp. GGD]MCY6493814.1 hypothetical protein [Leptolyngbya sp. GGD]